MAGESALPDTLPAIPADSISVTARWEHNSCHFAFEDENTRR